MNFSVPHGRSTRPDKHPHADKYPPVQTSHSIGQFYPGKRRGKTIFQPSVHHLTSTSLPSVGVDYSSSESSNISQPQYIVTAPSDMMLPQGLGYPQQVSRPLKELGITVVIFFLKKNKGYNAVIQRN